MKIIRQAIKEKNVLALSSQFIHAGFGFLSFILLTRSFEKEVFGAWVLYITAIAFVEMFRFGLTRTAMVRFLSGANKKEAALLNGSNWRIGTIISISLAGVVFIVNLVFNESIQASGYKYFFSFYPILTFLNFPYHNAITVLQAQQKFDKILLLRNMPVGLFVMFLILNLFVFKLPMQYVVIVHITLNGLVSVFASLKNWNAITDFGKYDKATVKKILDFGKFSMGTLIGNNLLKSADTFIIGLSPILGPAGVAIYSVPLKLTEVMEIPLRSFASTAFPKMSKASLDGDSKAVRQLFYANSGGITLLFIPGLILAFFLAKPLVVLLGGEAYAYTDNIFRVFCIYGLMLPVDRFIGVALDSINKPKNNFIKVVYMATANVIGDILAIFVAVLIFPDLSVLQILMMVATVTIIMKLTGVLVGWRFLNKNIKINAFRLFKEGWWFYKSFIGKIFQKLF